MDARIERDVRFLKVYALVTSTVIIGLSVMAFSRHSETSLTVEIRAARATFEVIDVERINVMERDGKYRLALSSSTRSDGPIYKVKPFLFSGTGRTRTA